MRRPIHWLSYLKFTEYTILAYTITRDSQENEFSPGGQDNDFCPGWCNSDLNPGVAIFSKLPSEELVQFSFEDAISDKLTKREKTKSEHGRRVIFLPSPSANPNLIKIQHLEQTTEHHSITLVPILT